MASTTKQLQALQKELGLLRDRSCELSRRIAALYNNGRDKSSADRAFELWQEEFQPLLAELETVQRSIRQLTPPAPRNRSDGRHYPRKRQVN